MPTARAHAAALLSALTALVASSCDPGPAYYPDGAVQALPPAPAAPIAVAPAPEPTAVSPATAAPAPEPTPAAPPSSPAPAPATSPVLLAPTTPGEVADIINDCAVDLRVQMDPGPSPDRRVRVIAENKQNTAITLTLPERCPNGLIDFHGLDDGYDYYGTCNTGPCIKPNGTTTLKLKPHERRTLAETTLHLSGRAPCTKPLTPGKHMLLAEPPQNELPICSQPLFFEVPGKTLPAPVAPAGAECSTAADCVLSCPNAPGCCGWPCGCNNAIPRSKQASFEANYAKTCQRAPKCPPVGCAYQPAMGATCHAGRCIAVSSLGGF